MDAVGSLFTAPRCLTVKNPRRILPTESPLSCRKYNHRVDIGPEEV